MPSRFNLPIPFGWYAVALSGDIQAGTSTALSYFGTDLALFRTEDGVAQVVAAMCPHLGAHLGVGSRVEGDSLVCAFHGWQFNGDGFCTEIPYANKTPARAEGKQCLKSYPSQELNGVIWAWYHPNGEQPLFELEPVAEFNTGGQWDTPVVDEWTVAAPIQETGENAVDTAHFSFVHTMENVPEAEIEIDGYHRVTRLHNRIQGINKDGSRTDDYSGTVTLNSFNNGPGQTIQRIGGSFDVVLQGTITPIDADKTHMRFMFAVAKEQSEDAAVMQDAFRTVMSDQVEQDIPIWNNKFYNDNPILCDGDGPIAQYRKWFSQFYAS